MRILWKNEIGQLQQNFFKFTLVTYIKSENHLDYHTV